MSILLSTTLSENSLGFFREESCGLFEDLVIVAPLFSAAARRARSRRCSASRRGSRRRAALPVFEVGSLQHHWIVEPLRPSE